MHTTTEIRLAEHDVGKIFNTISNHIKRVDTLIFVSSKVLTCLEKYGESFNIFSVSTNIGECYSLHKEPSWNSPTLAVASFANDCKEFYRLAKFWEHKNCCAEYLYYRARPDNLVFIDTITSNHNHP